MWRRKRRPGLMVVALCLGGALTACGGSDDGEGYAALGAGSSPKGAVPPSGSVTLVPLDPATTAPGLTSSTSRPSPAPEGREGSAGSASSPDGPDGPGSGTSAGTGTGTGTGRGVGTGTEPGGTATAPPPVTGAPAPPRTPGSPATTPGPAPTPTAPAPAPSTTAPAPAPALLTLSTPVLTDTDRRWCENVTVTFRNTGGTAARSGTVTFATHVIGALGIDWATVTTTQPLPAPIQAGTTRTHTYTVCVDSWRVPIGMRVDTRKVTASWR
ncbi:hypothetical protein AB0A60_08550 [Streptomyces sp. NPDC046275]|uniref:hypothetical protein n=1 Tax=Streptomyces sp. NPDC046275 TaxID=3157201 RepID=UPI0034056D3A